MRLPPKQLDYFDLIHDMLRAKYGAPRTTDVGGVLREFFKVDDERAIMLATKLSPFEGEENEDAT